MFIGLAGVGYILLRGKSFTIISTYCVSCSIIMYVYCVTFNLGYKYFKCKTKIIRQEWHDYISFTKVPFFINKKFWKMTLKWYYYWILHFKFDWYSCEKSNIFIPTLILIIGGTSNPRHFNGPQCSTSLMWHHLCTR